MINMAQKYSNFYDLLRVPKTASVHEINQSYRKLAREFHPDKNPSAGDIFKEISYAHEVLTDSNKRYLYDRYGIEGLQGGVCDRSNPNFSEMFPHMSFSSFFDFSPGMGIFSGFAPRQHCVEDTFYKIAVTLEDLYQGKTIKYSIKRNVVCLECHGKGSISGIRQFCHRCLGTGHPLGSSILSISMSCLVCGGAGFIIPGHDRCSRCSGAAVLPQDVIVDVVVDKGMKNGDRIVMHSQGDQAPGAMPGNIVFVLEEQPHRTFTRNGNDLYVDKVLDLTDALCGFTFPLRHLNGSVLKVVQPPGECIGPGQIKMLPNKGMPILGPCERWGALHVEFQVKLPPNNFANALQLMTLEEVLGPRQSEFTMPHEDSAEEVDLLDYDPKRDSRFVNVDPDDHFAFHDRPPYCAAQ